MHSQYMLFHLPPLMFIIVNPKTKPNLHKRIPSRPGSLAHSTIPGEGELWIFALPTQGRQVKPASWPLIFCHAETYRVSHDVLENAEQCDLPTCPEQSSLATSIPPYNGRHVHWYNDSIVMVMTMRTIFCVRCHFEIMMLYMIWDICLSLKNQNLSIFIIL